MADWLDVGSDRDDLLSLKATLLAERYDDVFALLDDRANEEGAEAARLVRDNMRTYYPDVVLAAPDHLSPLDAAGRLVVEDLCLMGERHGQLVLTGASLCFPNRWRLADKLGHTMADIHVPVAQYAEHVGSATDSFLERLSVDRPVWRANWGVVDDPTLFQPTGHGLTGGATSANPAELFLRVERQALIRLPETRAILFSIRTLVTPLPIAVARADDRARLAGALEGLPSDVARYKSMSSFVTDVVSWLRSSSPTL
jgi:dimethylamine monooxygenase subunit A